jgi:hypothetical protein
MTMQDDLRAKLLAAYDSETTDALLDIILAVLSDAEWHGLADCPRCDMAHCPETYGHDSTTDLVLEEAVQMLHRQAHNGPREPLDASRCRREPCVTVAMPQGSMPAVLAVFAPGSRVA